VTAIAILMMRYGLNGQPEQPFEKIGATLGLTRQKVGQIATEDLQELRAAVPTNNPSHRLSVRGSLWLLDRIRRLGVKTEGLGTLWSLYREQNKMHRKVVDTAARGTEPFNLLPKPFNAVIPNATAIAEAAEPDRRPKSFTAKYSPPFAKLYRSLCQEIVQRSQWGAAQLSEAEARVGAASGVSNSFAPHH
jgi:hypothetical protein